MNNEEFYLVSDNDYLITVFEQELAFVKSNWYSSGRPTMVVMLTDQMLGALRSNKNQRNSSKRNLFNFMMSLRSGICGGARVRLGRLSEMINTACIESLDFLTSSDQENWHCVLAGKNDSHTEQFVRLSLKDHMKSMESAEEGKGIPRKRRTVRRRSSSEHSINRSSKSPLTKPIIPAEEEDSNLGNFKLREHLEAPYLEDRRSQNSPVKSNDEIRDSIGGVDMADGSSDDGPALVLTLGDHSNVQSAIDVLRTSSNLYDQIDLLHYLHSCHGPDFTVDGLSTVSKLIEEVYVKATHLGQWSIVRQAAGLLRKVVNNLSINIAELLIRQKPVTVGFGDQTFSITSPMRPTALADVIYKHCWSDVREAPVVQEVITSMASFLKTNESMFEGIMCIRTHFVIIAMREEISRMKSCNEEQAVEYLMQLSPFEFKSLLGQVLMAREQTSHPTSAIQENTIKQAVSITCQSGGFKAGNFAHIDVSVDGEGQSNRGIFGRGLNVVIISPQSGAIIETGSFDTHVSQEESNEFAKTIEWTEPGSIVVVVSKDECSENLTEAAKVACESIGSSHIRSLKYRESWCIIGEKGAVMGSVPEALRGALSGPTDAIRKSVDLQVKKGSVHDHLKTQTKFNKMLPSQGRWLRRRKIDGALNRVPAHFYPKVWQLLNKTKGLKIGKAFLPREPTVNEKTPEELNFALQTETLLDHISDPAERQIAVDCIVVISRIEERNPLITLHCGAIDVLHIIREAIRTFWGKHLEANPHFLGPAAASTGPGKGVDMSPLQGSSDGSKAGKKKGHEVSLVSGISGPHSLSPVETNTTTSYPATPATNGPKRPNQRASVPDKNFSGLRKALDHDVIPVAPDTSFEQNERLARVLFLDLPSEGREGTLSYLAAACVRLVFDVEWTNDDALGLA